MDKRSSSPIVSPNPLLPFPPPPPPPYLKFMCGKNRERNEIKQKDEKDTEDEIKSQNDKQKFYCKNFFYIFDKK